MRNNPSIMNAFFFLNDVMHHCVAEIFYSRALIPALGNSVTSEERANSDVGKKKKSPQSLRTG